MKNIQDFIHQIKFKIINFSKINQVIKKYSLEKKLHSNNIEINFPSRPNMKKEVMDSIQTFQERILTNIPNVNLKFFSKNIETLKIAELDESIINSSGAYIFKENKIVLSKEDPIATIYHELLHLSSTTYVEDELYSGFLYQKDNPNHLFVGLGLTEGYTSILTERYFKDLCSGNGYLLIINFVQKLDMIIGKERMEELYFNGNLFAPIKELEQYESKRNIQEFILNLDYVIIQIFEKTLETNQQKCEASLNRVANFLLSCYTNKAIQEFNPESITITDALIHITKFADLLHHGIYFHGIDFSWLNINELTVYLNRFSNNISNQKNYIKK